MLNKEQLVEGFKQLNVLVIGDLMIDSYTWGKATRISPEAPVPVVNVSKKEDRLGGAGNVVRNLVSLGAKPLVVSVVGKDANAQVLKSLFHELGVETSGILEDAHRPTTVKERILAGSQQLLRIDAETDSPISSELQAAVLEKVKSYLPSVQVLIFEDYDKGVLDENLIKNIIKLAKEHGVPTVVDPKKRNFFAYQGVDLFKPNLSELKEGLRLSKEDLSDESLPKVVSDFKTKQAINGIFVTLSERGVYIDYKGESAQIPAHVRQIADVSGAGDTVISIAACALALGLPAKEIAELANLGGGLVCESLGVVPIELKRLLNEWEKL